MRYTCILYLTKFHQDCTIYNKVKLVQLYHNHVHVHFETYSIHFELDKTCVSLF